MASRREKLCILLPKLKNEKLSKSIHFHHVFGQNVISKLKALFSLQIARLVSWHCYLHLGNTFYLYHSPPLNPQALGSNLVKAISGERKDILSVIIYPMSYRTVIACNGITWRDTCLPLKKPNYVMISYQDIDENKPIYKNMEYGLKKSFKCFKSNVLLAFVVIVCKYLYL